MKKIIVLVSYLAFTLYSWSQTGVINGGFEQWQYKVMEETPTSYSSNSASNVFSGAPASVIKDSINKHSGKYALRVLTTSGDHETRGGVVVSVDVMPEGPNKIWGGFPYALTPDSIKGYYKYFTGAGDSALIIVMMKKNGVQLTFDVFKAYGVQNVFKSFAYKLSVPAMAPDTIVIAFLSSNDLGGGPPLNPGNWMIVDDISFTGGVKPMPPIPNAGFESWYKVGYDDPLGWNSSNVLNVIFKTPFSVRKITPPYSDYFAVSIKTSRYGIPEIDSTGFLTTGNLFQGMQGGFPMDTNFRPDSIGFYYKYDNSNGTFDSATFFQSFSRYTSSNGHIRLNMIAKMLPASGVYKFVTVKFDFMGPNPDTCMLTFYSSHPFKKMLAGIGNELIVDQLTFYYGNVGVPATDLKNGLAIMYPNPARGICTLRFSVTQHLNYQLLLTDMQGRIVKNILVNAKPGLNLFDIDVSDLVPGNYLYLLEGNNSRLNGKITIR